MHMADPGITKKMLEYIFNNNSTVVINCDINKVITQQIVFLSPYIPKEFQRKPRGIDELPRWKATEYRKFALYYGPLVLKDHVHDDFYNEFLLFHVAYRLISTPRHYQENVDMADKLLQKFVINFEKFYGECSVVFNVHSLLHLGMHASKYGIISNFCAYYFEIFSKECLQRCPLTIKNNNEIVTYETEHY